MNKELFVSSTPHETKVGLVEDDLLAEIYLERENEYTLAGSIYKGRVTRVLPGMQSAFVDIGLERDAFLYVSDFMELEDQDEDLTDVVPANRGVQDLRPQPMRIQAPAEVSEAGVVAETAAPAGELESGPGQGSEEPQSQAEGQSPATAGAGTESAGGDFERERGGWRGRRRRRGGRRDGRGDGRDRGSEARFSRPAAETAPPRAQESGRTQQFGPPAGYQPILLPGESISKYQRWAQPPVQEPRTAEQEVEPSASNAEPDVPLAATFPEDEPIFASPSISAEPLHEQHDDSRGNQEEHVEAASTSVDWNRELRRAELTDAFAAEAAGATEEIVEEVEEEDTIRAVPEHRDQPLPTAREQEAPVFAAPGTMEEETIDEEEADTIRYEESSDEGYDEFEEETQAATPEAGEHLNGDAREAVSEIHLSSLAEGGEAPPAEAGAAEAEDDSEEFELEEAQAEAEALLDAEARGNGTVDARAEVRAPAATAGYTQRTQRPRPGFDRQGGGQRGRRGGRRFRRRESAPVPLISDLLKEGQEILVQIAKEPIARRARASPVTSHCRDASWFTCRR